MVRRFALALCLSLPAPAALFAGEGAAPDEAQALQERIQGWVARLGAEEWKDREEASSALIKIGKDAVPALQKAAASEDPEVRTRARAALRIITEQAGAAPPPGDAAPGPPREKDPFEPPVPFNRDFAEWMKKMLEDPFGPGAPPGGELPEELRRLIEGLQRRQGAGPPAGWDGSQKSVSVRDGETVELERDASGKITVAVTRTGEDGEAKTERYEAPSEEAFETQHPEAYAKYVKGRFGFRVRVLPPGQNPFDDWWKDFDEEFRRFRRRWDPTKRWEELERERKEMEEWARRLGEGMPRGPGSNRVFIEQDGERIALSRSADGRVELSVRRRDADGNLVEDRYEAASEEEFEKKFPEVHAKYLKNGRVRIRFGPAAGPRPGGASPGLGVQPGPVSELMRIHLGLEADAGFVVQSVRPGSPAHRAGLEQWDLVLRAGGRTVRAPEEVMEALAASEGALTLELVRRGKTLTVTLPK